MLVHDVKLLELVALESNKEKNYLQIKLTFGQKIDLFWEIDDATAENLKAIYERNGIHKYRISLNSSHDILKENYVSSLTKTYRDISEPLFFVCSLEYKNNLEAINSSKCIAELIELPFIYVNQPASNVTPPVSVQHKVAIKKRMTTTFSWLFAIISVLLLIFTVSSHHLTNKGAIEGTVVIAAQPPIHISPVTMAMNKSVILPVTVEDSAAPPHLSYTTADDFITYSVPDGSVALTFDDGPSKYTTDIINILKEYNVGGTFFFLGANAKKHPDAVRYALESGYSIGNHSMNHYDMTKLTFEEQEDELLRTAEVIEEITNKKMVLFRPPYGALNEQLTDIAQSHQFKIVQWNSDPEDWKTHSAVKIINYVRGNDPSGSIIILHETQAVVDALPSMIEFLQEQNLNIVNLQ